MTRSEAKAALLAAYPKASIGITVSEVFSARGSTWLDYHVCINGMPTYKHPTLHGAVEQALTASRRQQTEAETDAHFEGEVSISGPLTAKEVQSMFDAVDRVRERERMRPTPAEAEIKRGEAPF